jgi:hypothetical protein
MSITIEQVYEKLVELTDLCEHEFKDVRAQLADMSVGLQRLERRVAKQDAKIDAFIEDVIEMKRDLKHSV